MCFFLCWCIPLLSHPYVCLCFKYSLSCTFQNSILCCSVLCIGMLSPYSSKVRFWNSPQLGASYLMVCFFYLLTCYNNLKSPSYISCLAPVICCPWNLLIIEYLASWKVLPQWSYTSFRRSQLCILGTRWLHAQWKLILVQQSYKNPKIQNLSKPTDLPTVLSIVEYHIFIHIWEIPLGLERAVSNPKWFKVTSGFACMQPKSSSEW